MLGCWTHPEIAARSRKLGVNGGDMKTLTFMLMLILAPSSLVAQSHNGPSAHTGQSQLAATCGVGATFITEYGTYLEAVGDRPILCANLALGAARQRGIMAPDVGLDMRQRYIGAQQEICRFTVQGARLGISLSSLAASFSTVCRNGDPTAIDSGLAEIVTIETMLEAARTGR